MFKSHSSIQPQDRTCRLCTQEVSDAIHLYSEDSVERGVANRMANVLELPFDQEDGLSSYVCQLCNARFNHLVRALAVNRLHAKKSYEKLAENAGLLPCGEDYPPESDTNPHVEDIKDTRDPLVQAANMTSMDLGSLLSDLVAAQRKMKKKKAQTEKKIVTDDIKDLMNLLSGVKDWFVFGTFLGIPTTRLHDIEHNYPGDENLQRRLTEVVMAWITTCPKKATWTNLVEALTEIGRRKNAQQVAEKRGITVPGVFEEGSLWKALKSLIPIQEGGSGLIALLDETEQLRKDVKTKDALLLHNEERLVEVNSQMSQLEQQNSDTLQLLEEQKELLEAEKNKAQKDLREKEAELRRLRANRADKETIETLEIEIMYLRKKIEQQKTREKDLVKQMVELQGKLEVNDIGSLQWIAQNLEKQMEGVQPEFERERSQMIYNIYKLLSHIKIPEDIDSEEEEHKGSPEPGILATEDSPEKKEEVEEEKVKGAVTENTPEPEPTNLQGLLSSLEKDADAAVFGDKPFVEEDLDWALSLFEGVSPFLLSQILSLPMERWMAIEAGDPEEEGKQRGSVLGQWGKGGSAAMWSVLVEALIELGRRSTAQTACIEKGVPLPVANEDGPLWQLMKETLSKGNEVMQDLLVEIEDLRSKVKTKDERMCISETQLEQDRSKSVLVRANLNRAKMNLAEEIAQCKLLEMKVNQKSNDLKALQKELESEQLKGTQSNEKAKEKYRLEQEIGRMKEQHRRHMDAIQTLWRERENRREEDEAHSSVLVPLEEQISQMKEGFDEERETLLMKLEESYDLHTGRDRKESLGPPRKRGNAITKKPKPKPQRPPPPKRVSKKLPPTAPGYRNASQSLLPTTDPILPTGYTIMDLFHPNNLFCLLPAVDIVGRPVVLTGNLLAGSILKGRGALSQECIFTAEIAAPWIITLKMPNRGRIWMDDGNQVFIRNTTYNTGDPAFEFVVRPYENKKVTFESRKAPNHYLSMNQNADMSLRQLPPDSSEVQFAVRVERFSGPYTTPLTCPFSGTPSVASKLRDRYVIQLFSKKTGLHLGLTSGGGVVSIQNPDSDKTFLVYCDRGLGRVSLEGYRSKKLKIKMRFTGELTCWFRGAEENLDNDFFLKENPDGTVVFESVPNKGRFITIPGGNEQLRNFSIKLLNFTKGKGKTSSITKNQLN